MEYLIKKGKHYAKWTFNRLFPFTGSKIDGVFMFEEDCLTTATPSGWNKLTGISSLRIHENSGRLVWRSNGSEIIIAGYIYKHGIREEREICRVNALEISSYSIEYVDNIWEFVVNGTRLVMSGHLGFWKTRCYPYFGGRAVAPCDMRINIS